MQSDSADYDDAIDVDLDLTPPRGRFVSHTDLRAPLDETAPPSGPPPKTLPSNPPPPPSDRHGHISEDEAVSVVAPVVAKRFSLPKEQRVYPSQLAIAIGLILIFGLIGCFFLQGSSHHVP